MNAEKLRDIKDKRKALAHGNFSFLDIGKDFSPQDLIKFKDQTFAFLSDIVLQVEDFINTRKYLT